MRCLPSPLPAILLAIAGCVGCCPSSLAAAAAIGGRYGTPLVLDRSFLFRFECPPEHLNLFSVTYLPLVWRQVNSSLDRLRAGHGLTGCPRGWAADALPASPARSCLTLESGQYQLPPGEDGNQLTVYEISVQLQGRPGQSPHASERAAFGSEGARARLNIEAIEGIWECAKINVTAWARAGDGDGGDGGCAPDGGGACRAPTSTPSGGSSVAAAVAAILVAASLTAAIAGAVVLARRRRLRQRDNCQRLEDPTPQPQLPPNGVRPRHDRGRRYRQPVSASAAVPVSIVGAPLAGADRLGWLNLAYQPDSADQLLPSAILRLRGVDPARFVDASQAVRQFAQLGSVGGGDSHAFYRVSNKFVLASPSPDAPAERLLELLWDCGGVAVSVDPINLVDRLTTSASSAASPGRFHLAAWDTHTMPCYSTTTATMLCLDTNLTKRLRICQFTGRWDPASDAPVSRAEFIRFASACADHLPATSLAMSAPPVAALGPSLSSASLLPAFLTAVEQLRSGGNGCCDLLRLAALLRRQCPGAVASLQHYLFLTHCLHAYAFLLKRNSI